jgi:large subunit ribosomal protein L9
MKVVLNKDVKDLGSAGDVRDVSDGYARNYLFPRRLAVPATKSALKQVQEREQAAARRRASEEEEARRVAQRLEHEPLRLHPKVGSQGRLYGSVTAADVAEALSKQLGQAIDRRKIELPEPIRMVGEYRVPYRITHSVTATVIVQVEQSGGTQE